MDNQMTFDEEFAEIDAAAEVRALIDSTRRDLRRIIAHNHYTAMLREARAEPRG